MGKDFADIWTSFWSKVLPNHKRKGFGIAIFIKNKWACYIRKINYISPYVMTLQLVFRQCHISITNIYRCPNDDQNSKNILTYINNILLKGYKDDGKTHYIIIGDFNAMADSALNKFALIRNSQSPKTSTNLFRAESAIALKSPIMM